MFKREARIDIRHVDMGKFLGDSAVSDMLAGFIGSMQKFSFNGHFFFEMARTGQMENIQLTAQLSSGGYIVIDPITFQSVDSYVVLPRLQAHDRFSVSFLLKTTESYGLLFYNSGKGQDFFAIELSDGFLSYVYNMGSGAQRILVNMSHRLNDNRWHEVRLLRSQTYRQLIRVDNNTPTVDNLSAAKSIHFDLQGPLYIGGVTKTMYYTLPQKILSQYGYIGCIASLDLNGYLPNVMKEANLIHAAVGDGCQGQLAVVLLFLFV